MTAPDSDTAAGEFLSLVDKELRQALALFQDTAAAILDKSGVVLNPPSPAYFSLDNNFFSALFLYSYVRGGIRKERRIYYAAMNHCLRGMVTGCDNILDDEYKPTLDTDLPGTAHKFRSILDIMVCDRVLTALMLKGCEAGCFSRDQVLTADTASLHALLKSGVQEASEEKGVETTLAPSAILSDIHSLKTGLLFQAPWVLPGVLEGDGFVPPEQIKEGLFFIGLGCQIMDDMVDLARDLVNRRHNYVASVICHGDRRDDVQRLEKLRDRGDMNPEQDDLLNKFPHARKQASHKALELLEAGCGKLFAPEHRLMVPFAVSFFARRIGADRFPEIMP